MWSRQADRTAFPCSSGSKTAATATIGPTGCSWKVKRVTTPKLPPRAAQPQNSSASSPAWPARTRPSAVTTSAASRLSSTARRSAQPAVAAAQRQPGDAGAREDAARRCQPVLRVAAQSPQVTPPPACAVGSRDRPRRLSSASGQARGRRRRSRSRPRCGYRRCTASGSSCSRANSTAATDIGRAVSAPPARLAVDHAVPDGARRVVPLDPGPQHRATDAGGEPRERLRVDRSLGHHLRCHCKLLSRVTTTNSPASGRDVMRSRVTAGSS